MRKQTALLLLLPVLASADPGPAIRWLISEPASLLDLGVSNLERWVSDDPEFFDDQYSSAAGYSEKTISTHVRYEFKNDKIVIGVLVTTRDVGKSEAGCRQIAKQAQNQFSFAVKMAFMHEGYQSQREPADLGEQLLQRTDLECVVIDGETLKYHVTVRTNLHDKSISVTQASK